MYDVLENHFHLLDNAEVSPESIFKTWEDKERYESLLMFSFRKLQAANYHCENVNKFIAREKEELNKERLDFSSLTASSMKVTSYSGGLRTTRTADEYIYELSAFLEALKSSLDLLAEVCSYHLQGVSTNYSIKPLLRLAEKDHQVAIIVEIIAYRDWLSSLRDYRHHLVHRLMPSVKNGYQVEYEGNLRAQVYYPVVVPQKTSSYVPDTRNTQMQSREYDGFKGITKRRIISRIQKGGEPEEISQIELHADIQLGYQAIDKFMEEHLKSYQEFCRALFHALASTNFKPVKISGG